MFVYLYIIFSCLFDQFLFENISFFEVGSILFVLNIIITTSIKKIQFHKDDFFLSLYVFFVAFSLIFIHSNEYFDPSIFQKNFLRLLFYSLSFIIIPKILSLDKFYNIVIKLLPKILILVSVLGFIEFILFQFNIKYSFSSISTQYASGRISSLFSEPAHMGIYIGPLLSALIYIDNKFINENKICYSFSVIALLLSFSLSSYFFLLVIFYQSRFLFLKNKKMLFLPFLIFIMLFPRVNNLIIDRTQNINQGLDGSALHRLNGAIELFNFLLKEKPIIGTGLSHHKVFLFSKRSFLKYHYLNKRDGGSSGINNIFLAIFIQTGIIGLIIFCLFLFYCFRYNKFFLLLISIVFIVWGLFNTPYFWFIIILFKTLTLRKNNFHLLKNR